MVKAEALRLKNEIELEKLIQNEQSYNPTQNVNDDADANKKENKSARIRY